jgi:hypothetical protein
MSVTCRARPCVARLGAGPCIRGSFRRAESAGECARRAGTELHAGGSGTAAPGPSTNVTRGRRANNARDTPLRHPPPATTPSSTYGHWRRSLHSRCRPPRRECWRMCAAGRHGAERAARRRRRRLSRVARISSSTSLRSFGTELHAGGSGMAAPGPSTNVTRGRRANNARDTPLRHPPPATTTSSTYGDL